MVQEHGRRINNEINRFAMTQFGKIEIDSISANGIEFCGTQFCGNFPLARLECSCVNNKLINNSSFNKIIPIQTQNRNSKRTSDLQTSLPHHNTHTHTNT